MAEDLAGMAVKIAMDSTSFQQGMQTLKRQLSIIDSGFKASIAGVKDWGDSIDGLKANATALSDKISIQQQIVQQYQEQLDKSKASLQANAEKMIDLKTQVEAAKAAWDESKASLGANGEATLKLQQDYEALNITYQSQESLVRNNARSLDGYTIQVNNAEARLRSMESELASVNNQLEEGQNKQSAFSEVTSKLGLNMTSLKTAFGAVGVAAGAFLDQSIKVAEEEQNANANLEQTIKSTGDAVGLTSEQLEEFAGSEQRATTFSKDTIEAGEAMLLTFTNIGQSVFPQATQALLDLSQKMGSEPKDAAIQLGKALNDPVKGISALQRVGVTFSAKQKETIATLVKTGDVAGAQKVILAELNKEFGGQATAASKTYDGQMKQLQNTLEATKASIGLALLPILAKLGGALADILKPIAAFVEENPGFTAAVLSIVAVVGTLVGGLSLLSTLAGVFAPFATMLMGVEVSAASLILPILGVIAAIAALAAIAFEVYKNWGPISKFFENLWAGIVDTTQSAWNGIKGFFNNLWNWTSNFFSQWGPLILVAVAPVLGIPLLVIQHWGEIRGFLAKLWDDIKLGLTAAWNGIKAVAMAVITPIVQGVQNLFDGMKAGLNNIFTGLKNIFQGAWTVIKTIVLGAVLLICDLITGDFTKLHTDLTGILNNLRKGFSQIWEGIKQYFTGVLQAIAGFFKTEWNGIVSTATNIGNTLKNLFLNLWNSIKNTATNTWNGILKFFRGIPQVFASVGTSIKNTWNSVISYFSGLPRRFASLVGNIGFSIKNGFNSAISYIRNLPANMLTWGKDMIQGLIKGITSAIGGIKNAVGNVANTIRSVLHFSVPDEGPLTDYESWMPDFMSGLAKGIQKSKHLVSDAISGLAGDIQVGIKPSTVPAMAAATTALTPVVSKVNTNRQTDNPRPVTINFNGNYGFNNKNDIDYFMNQAAILVQRRKN